MILSSSAALLCSLILFCSSSVFCGVFASCIFVSFLGISSSCVCIFCVVFMFRIYGGVAGDGMRCLWSCCEGLGFKEMWWRGLLSILLLLCHLLLDLLFFCGEYWKRWIFRIVLIFLWRILRLNLLFYLNRMIRRLLLANCFNPRVFDLKVVRFIIIINFSSS